MAVDPGHQGRGVGTALITSTLDELVGLGEALVVVLGETDYYARFGFEPAEPHGVLAPRGLPQEYLMVKLLADSGRQIRGEVEYHDAFTQTGAV